MIYYYLKDALLKEPITMHGIIFNKEYEENKQYEIVKIPQQELEIILLKNKLGGYLTFTNMVSEQEFDKTFEELYQELIEKAK